MWEACEDFHVFWEDSVKAYFDERRPSAKITHLSVVKTEQK
jgi:hypothetical protein